MKVELNINQEVIIFPNKLGWEKIRLVDRVNKRKHFHNDEDYLASFQNKMVENGGFKEQLWVVIDELHELFESTNRYLENSKMIIIDKE
jgi:hypothetical protein